jgi:hypothetical protein
MLRSHPGEKRESKHAGIIGVRRTGAAAMMLIDRKGTRRRVVCERCHHAKSDVKRLGWWCEDCRTSAIAESVADYQEQVESGVPYDERWIMIPINLEVFDEDFIRRVRELIEGLDCPRKARLIAV